MTERPIPFSAEMARAILKRRKTQTRRLMKNPPPDERATGSCWFDDEGGAWVWLKGLPEGHAHGVPLGQCRYGKPGDTLWVREAWRAWSQYDDWPPSRLPPGVDVQYIADAGAPWSSRYRSPRYMPRWASRITLRITDIRVERLQDITQKDAIAEGAPESHSDIDRISRRFGYQDFSRSWFAQTWENINGPGAWEANPWVWAISFERVKP